MYHIFISENVQNIILSIKLKHQSIGLPLLLYHIFKMMQMETCLAPLEHDFYI